MSLRISKDQLGDHLAMNVLFSALGSFSTNDHPQPLRKMEFSYTCFSVMFNGQSKPCNTANGSEILRSPVDS